jgi:hypothetical protein
MQSSYAYTVESTHPYSLEVSECITDHNLVITQPAFLLINLISILLEEGVPEKSYSRAVERIARRLEKHLDLWDLYLMKEEEEYKELSLELEATVDERHAHAAARFVRLR